MYQDLAIQKQYGTHHQEPSEGCICHKQQNDNQFKKYQDASKYNIAILLNAKKWQSRKDLLTPLINIFLFDIIQNDNI
jgi:hypothetical protein